ncbi:hypothetical protein ACGFIF_08140 [Kribbella sp. NPDC049174]|uniref:hypothetical protein n=1 Tax=Kribbella sp. NPDC049174 TaxID=3364112 RepID=UPI00371E1816
MRRTLAAATGLALTAVLTTPAAAAPSVAGATVPCAVGAASATAGDHFGTYLEATKPITRTDSTSARGALDLPIRFYSDWFVNPDADWNTRVFGGYLVAGDILYDFTYWVQRPAEVPKDSRLIRIGGGWTGFRALVTSQPIGSDPEPVQRQYGLHADGTLYRWVVRYVNDKPVWTRNGVFSGFSAVKTMALFSRTATYDTLLVTTRGGALYTVRIPHSQPTTPVVKKVRASTWQGFETLVASRCGRTGTLLLGIDKDIRSGYLYAVGHANGTATVIQSLGKVPGTFPYPFDFRLMNLGVDEPLFGE